MIKRIMDWVFFLFFVILIIAVAAFIFDLMWRAISG